MFDDSKLPEKLEDAFLFWMSGKNIGINGNVHETGKIPGHKKSCHHAAAW